MNQYDINSIESLTFREGVRKRISMYLGSNDMQGVYNGIQEIISNSIDEFYMKYGKEINVSLIDHGNDVIVKVEDFGRGIPFGVRDDGSNVLVDIFSRPHTGGKFNERVYIQSSGLNGIGAKATCLSSKWFKVVSHRGQMKATAEFEEGELIHYSEEKTSRQSGTVISFIPDEKVFNLEPIEISFDRIATQCKNLSYLTKGLKFNLKYNSQKKSFLAKNGLRDLVQDYSKGPIHPTVIYGEAKEGRNHVEVAMMWTNNRTESSYTFTNGLLNSEGGTSLTGVRTALTRILKKEVGDKAQGATLRSGLVYAVAARVEKPSFGNQTKTKVNNPELNGLAQKATKDAMDNFHRQNIHEYNKIIEVLSKTEKAERAAERAREAVMQATKQIDKAQNRKVIDPTKLKDAEYLGEDSTLLIVEGNSASASMTNAREVEHYGVLGIRGKLINCLSNPEEKIYQNEEILLLLQALNLNPKNYDPKKLRYGKVAVCTDADSDGMHIALLIMSAFLHLCPKFLEEGRLHWLRAPLYIVKQGRKEHYFYTDEEFAKSNIKGQVSRAKGLGSLEASQARASMFGAAQRMEKLNSSEESIKLLSNLMGENVEFRKDFIFNNVDFSKIME